MLLLESSTSCPFREDSGSIFTLSHHIFIHIDIHTVYKLIPPWIPPSGTLKMESAFIKPICIISPFHPQKPISYLCNSDGTQLSLKHSFLFTLLKWYIRIRCVLLITTWSLKFNFMYVQRALLLTIAEKVNCRVTVKPRLVERDRIEGGRDTLIFSKSLKKRPLISYKVECIPPTWKNNK